MSYDYNALVAEISKHRQQVITDQNDAATHLQQAVDTFSTLSTACPMTPLLWMQYASDASQLIQSLLENEKDALNMRLQTLQLGLAEFPSCAPLWLHYLQILVTSEPQQEGADFIQNAFEEALKSVGEGSHRNEGDIVAIIYRLYANYLAKTGKKDEAVNIFKRRAETPIKGANDGLKDEFQQFCHAHNVQVTRNIVSQLEQKRIYVSKTFSSLITWEDEVDTAMHQEGVLSRHQIVGSLEDDDTWKSLIQSQEQVRFWMGFGGAKTANAIVKYARACAKYTCPRDNEQDNDPHTKEIEARIHSLALCVYERGVSECPTVESLWLSYLKHMMYLFSSSHREQASLISPTKLKSVAARAVRNCPWSLSLYLQKLQVLAIQAEKGLAVLDPDAVMEIIQEAIHAKFLPSPQSYLDLHLTGIRTVKRRIMYIVSKATTAMTDNGNNDEDKFVSFDVGQAMEKAEGTPTKENAVELDEEIEQELQDLVEDLREMYDTTDSYLRKNHNSWNGGRVILWKDRAKTESLLLGPLMASLDNENDNIGDLGSKNSSQEMIRCYEKLVRLHQPTHPDCYIDYITSFLGSHNETSPGAVIANLRKVRGLYQKAFTSVKKLPNRVPETPESGSTTMVHRDVETALRSLCFDYIEFEQCFGSENSHSNAVNSVAKKLQPSGTIQNGKGHASQAIQTLQQDDSAQATKREADTEPDGQPLAKKPKQVTDDTLQQKSAATTAVTGKRANLKVEKEHPVFKVRVGKLEYPAHPFTVRVSNLSLETQDMDLVDLFKERCGPIVHARILREKHHGPGRVSKSKGCALVQFEERHSVEKALDLSDEVGLNEKLIKVERSHMHAVEVIPSGMHRVKPKGEGKSTKRNQQRRNKAGGKKQSNVVSSISTENAKGKPKEGEAGKSAKPDFDVLAFRPRGVAHGQGHRKVHIKIPQKDKGGTDKDVAK